MKRLTSEEKTEQLLKTRAILMATIDDVIQRNCDRFVLDGVDSLKISWEQQKQKMEEYFHKRRLDILTNKLQFYTRFYIETVDLSYGSYIKEKTGYDIDIFKEVRDRVQEILNARRLENEDDVSLATTYKELMNKEGLSNNNNLSQLEALIRNFYQTSLPDINKKQKGYTEVVKTVHQDNGDIVQHIHVSTGGRPKHFKEVECSSEDAEKTVTVRQWSDGKNPNSSVDLNIRGNAGSIYFTDGINDIKSYWKDNNTVVIETKKRYRFFIKAFEVRSLEVTVKIEYIET